MHLQWCGHCHGPTFLHGSMSACLYETTASALLLAFAVAQAAWQIRRVLVLERFQYSAPQSGGELLPPQRLLGCASI